MKKMQDLKVKWKMFFDPQRNIFQSDSEADPLTDDEDPYLCEETKPFIFQAKLRIIKNKNTSNGVFAFFDVEDNIEFKCSSSGILKMLWAIRNGIIEVDDEDKCFIGVFTFVKHGTKVTIEPFFFEKDPNKNSYKDDLV